MNDISNDDVHRALTALIEQWHRCQLPWIRDTIRKRIITLHQYIGEHQCSERRWWVRPIYRVEERFLQGASNNLIEDIRNSDDDTFFNFFRMTADIFDKLFEVVGPLIAKSYGVREPIPSRTRLEICIRYLATGDSMKSLAYLFRVAPNTVSGIISETCYAIWNSMQDVFLQKTEENWREVANGFLQKWNFPNCLGAVDGKHVVMQAPPNSGSTFFNYKGTHSIHLLAFCDANCCFTMVDIGEPGRSSDGGVFESSAIYQNLYSGALHIPDAKLLTVGGPKIPYVFVGDEGFRLTDNMMRPYPRRGNLTDTQQIFNYRLSRARRTIECAFGILTARWRIFRQPICASLLTIEKITMAATVLHNFIMKEEMRQPLARRRYSTGVSDNSAGSNGGLISINDRLDAPELTNAIRIRNFIAEYFIEEGEVEWQWDHAENIEH